MMDRFGPEIRAGAVALRNGYPIIGRPFARLVADSPEWVYVRAVLQEAERLRAEEERQWWENMQVAVRNGVAKAFVKG